MTTSTKVRRPERVVSFEPEPPEQPVTPARRRRQPRQYFAVNGVVLVIIVAVALSAICILYLVQTAKVARLGYQFSRLQDDYYSLSLEKSQLGYDVARKQSLDSINQVASQQLGMTPLTNYQFLQVERPANDDLPPVAPEVRPKPTIWERIKAAVTGEASASRQDSPTTAPADGGKVAP